MTQQSPTKNLIGGGGYPESTILRQNQNQNHADQTRPPGVISLTSDRDHISQDNYMQKKFFVEYHI